jgi:hypothetical protein
MLQSWNKLCFNKNAYFEVSASLPGTSSVGGFWPGIWTFGNLGRPGYGATTEGECGCLTNRNALIGVLHRSLAVSTHMRFGNVLTDGFLAIRMTLAILVSSTSYYDSCNQAN